MGGEGGGPCLCSTSAILNLIARLKWLKQSSIRTTERRFFNNSAFLFLWLLGQAGRASVRLLPAFNCAALPCPLSGLVPSGICGSLLEGAVATLIDIAAHLFFGAYPFEGTFRNPEPELSRLSRESLSFTAGSASSILD